MGFSEKTFQFSLERRNYMIYLVFLGGVILGSIITIITQLMRKTHGKMIVDHEKETCHVFLNSEEISKSKTNRVVLEVVHNSKTSQE